MFGSGTTKVGFIGKRVRKNMQLVEAVKTMGGVFIFLGMDGLIKWHESS